jgi:hypothetical protein
MYRTVHTLDIQLVHEGGHWRIELRVNGEVDSTTIFGCRQGFAPVFETFRAAETQVHAVGSGSESNVLPGEPSITVSMPSGRRLAFAFAGRTEAPPKVP